ncbi:MAG: GNAT family N-acetyltransferase [Thermoplasmata archaeon]|nr:GNAT family N-acetyltransferase [Thermoplasmata archaeon]
MTRGSTTSPNAPAEVPARRPGRGPPRSATGYTSQPLSPETWPAFARLVEKHHGIFGGCWCISFHLGPGEGKRTPAEYRAMKETRVGQGQAHAALVFDGPDAVGWCQFGPTAELPNIRSQKSYEEGLRELPDWRITCFFNDRERRGQGIANFALREALREIARLGGGTVEAYPEDVSGRKVSRSFLCSGTLGMFMKEGFEKARKIAMHRWVVVRRIPAHRSPLGAVVEKLGRRG